MTRVLVVYHSVTGHTRALAEAVAEGARSVEGIDCRLLPVGEVSNDDLLAADAIIVGSPTYFGQMASEVKRMFDASNAIYGRLEGRVGAAATTSCMMMWRSSPCRLSGSIQPQSRHILKHSLGGASYASLHPAHHGDHPSRPSAFAAPPDPAGPQDRIFLTPL